jgi:CubicO group peptidase (beta-lactamase class C family)
MKPHLVLLSLVAAASAQAQTLQSDRYARERARIDSLVADEVAVTPIAGVSIAVIKGRDTVALRGYGLADVENEVPVSVDHIFRIGSITKQFTSAAIMQLVEKGRLSLDDTLGAMLANTPAAWRKVTLSQLLNHTSGIPSYTDIGPRWARRMREDMLPDSIVGLVVSDSLNFPIGSRWRYNNTGYVLLGMILEKVTGKQYATLLEEQFSKPLGLTSTSYCLTGPIIKKRASGYARAGKQLMNSDFLSMTQPHAAGAMCSTARDLAKWNQALQSGRVVSAASLKQMTTPVGAAVQTGYGFGLGADTSLSGHRRISHGGGINGFLSMLAYYPNDSLTVVVLANTSPVSVPLIANNLARIMLGLPLEGIRLPRVALTPAQLAAYVGDYTVTRPNGSPLPLTVSIDGDRLMAQAQGQPKLELIPNGNHLFSFDFDRNMRLTFVVENGRASKLTMRQGGNDMAGVRK